MNGIGYIKRRVDSIYEEIKSIYMTSNDSNDYIEKKRQEWREEGILTYEIDVFMMVMEASFKHIIEKTRITETDFEE